MSRQLKTAKVKKDYKLFEGIYIEIMHKLIEQGYQPLATAEIMQERLKHSLSYDNYYDTATGIFYAGNNQDKFKILPFSEDLTRVTPETEPYNGGIKQTEEEYEKTKAREFTRKDMILNERLTEEEASEHQGWLELANNNQELLKKYIQSIFKQVKDTYNEDKAMKFYIRDPQEVPNIRAVYLGKLLYRSGADGGGRLGGVARLVGVSEKSAEGTLAKKRKHLFILNKR